MDVTFVTKVFISIAVLARLTLGLVFLIAGVAKVRDASAFREFLAAWSPTAGLLGKLIARLLPLFELGLGLLLLSGFRVRLAGSLATLLLTAFTAFVLAMVLTGRRTACGCFGTLDQKPVSLRTAARNAVLLAGALVVTMGNAAPLGVDGFRVSEAQISSSELFALLTILVSIVLIFITAWIGTWFRRRSLRPPALPEASIGPAWYGYVDQQDAFEQSPAKTSSGFVSPVKGALN